MAYFTKQYTGLNTKYTFTQRVEGFSKHDLTLTGTLTELAEQNVIVKWLLIDKKGKIDTSMIYEPIDLRLTIGISTYRLYRVTE